MTMQIDLRVPSCAPVSEVARFIAACEEAGFDGVGILDSQLLERDVFVSMAVAAQATSRIRIASAVLNPVTRHLSVIASAAKTVAELAPGRVEFWIGRGFSSVQTIGIPPATVAADAPVRVNAEEPADRGKISPSAGQPAGCATAMRRFPG